MNKYYISSIIRKLGLISFTDKLRFYIQFIRTLKLRRAFRKANPNAVLPPAYYIYETFNLNYFSFYNNSIETANWLKDLFEKHKAINKINVLDWGCGPGRVIRHLPSILDSSCSLYATDYNKKYIDWCKNNLADISFSTNRLSPPMEYQDDFFDIIYGISIFTHLSKDMHYKWFDELFRILKPGGIVIFTTHGEIFKIKLNEAEKKAFDAGDLIVKSNTKEGHRTYSSFQPIDFIKALAGKNEVLEHTPGKLKNGKLQQDLWVIKKNTLEI